jgi:hypothetical protein
MFEIEFGGVQITFDCQSGWRPNEDMKMSSALSFGAFGGHIFDVIAQGLKKHKFTAKLAQHVASELRVHLWTSRSRTDRNTPSRLTIENRFSNFRHQWIFCYNGFITDFMYFYRFSTCLRSNLEVCCQNSDKTAQETTPSRPFH